MELATQLLLLFLMAFMANGKVLIQGKFGRSTLHTDEDRIGYNGMLFGFSSVVFFALFFQAKWPALVTLLYAAVFGALSVLFQLVYIRAMECGPLSLTVLFCNFSLVPATLFGVIVYREPVSAFKIAGLLLLLVSFFFTIKPGREEKRVNARWLLLALAASLSSSLMSITQKLHAKSAWAEERTLYISWAYLIAFLLSLFLLLWRRCRGKRITFKPTPSIVLFTALAGLMLGGYQYLLLLLAKEMNSMVLYPINSGTCILVGFLFGKVFFGDRLTPRQWFGGGLGTAAIVLLSL